MSTFQSRAVAVTATVALLVGSACSDDDDSPGEPPVTTLFQETILIDPTPTTAP